MMPVTLGVTVLPCLSLWDAVAGSNKISRYTRLTSRKSDQRSAEYSSSDGQWKRKTAYIQKIHQHSILPRAGAGAGSRELHTTSSAGEWRLAKVDSRVAVVGGKGSFTMWIFRRSCRWDEVRTKHSAAVPGVEGAADAAWFLAGGARPRDEPKRGMRTAALDPRSSQL